MPNDVEEYPNAGHSSPTGPLNSLLKVTGLHHDHESSEDAWRRVPWFFATHLR